MVKVAVIGLGFVGRAWASVCRAAATSPFGIRTRAPSKALAYIEKLLPD